MAFSERLQAAHVGLASPPAVGLRSGGNLASRLNEPQDLDARSLEAMLRELLVGYKEPTFQKRILAAHSDAASDGNGMGLLARLGPIVLEVQAPVFAKYGLPPDGTGVELMKYAIQRRVAEGAVRLEAVANEGRKILGFDGLPDRKATAEQTLAAVVDETNAKLGIGKPAAEMKLAGQCRQRITAALSSGSVADKSGKLLFSLLEKGTWPIPSIMAMLAMAKLGTPLALLDGRGLPISVAMLDAPQPKAFFERFVLPGKPAVLRKVVDVDKFPPLTGFCDLESIRKKCGHRRVLVKSLAQKDSKGRSVFISDPELKLPLVAFLDALQDHEKRGAQVPFYLSRVPLRAELPELAEDVQNAEFCPQLEYGSCFGSLIPQGVFTYLGCGRNTTPVHWDAHENLMLCICGTKRLLLFPPSDARHLYPVNDFSRSGALPFASFKELPEHLQAKYRLLPSAKPLEVTLHAGEILYLPACWWHCVEGSDDTNMILNWWFNMHHEKRALAHGSSVCSD